MSKKTELTLKERINLTVRRAEKAAEAWLKENELQIEIKVRKMLDQRLQEIVAKTMGFNDNWGKWEVDHCNGRAGESLVGDWIRSHVKEAAMKWMEEQMQNLPDLPQTAMRDAKKTYLERLEYAIHERLNEVAWDNVNKSIQQVLGEEFTDGSP